MITTLTPQSIANSLSQLPTDGSSWFIPNWKYDYKNIKYNLIQALKYNINWHKVDYVDDIEGLKKWKNTIHCWETIIQDNDIAMFPKQLHVLKKFYITHVDMDCCETITHLSYKSTHSENPELYHRRLQEFYQEYGVFRFKCNIGNNLYKILRKHLKITDNEFENTYGLNLFYNPDCCDELLIEMLATGRLLGEVRSYKIESDGFYI